jgi:hypothetical protein
MSKAFYPNGVETTDSEVYVNCLCGKRIFWMKIENPIKKFPYLRDGQL